MNLWDFIADCFTAFFIPLASSYFAIISNPFFGTCGNKATGIESCGNTLLAPYHYLTVGQIASKGEDGEWNFTNRFQYQTHFAPKIVAAAILAAPSFVIGSCVKALALFDETQHKAIRLAYLSTHVIPQQSFYQEQGIHVVDEYFNALNLPRRPGDEHHLKSDKEALKEIGALLDEENIPWWVDCGTCLGTYRYGGVIPWDEDIDIAVLRPDFDNIRRALNQLDPFKYRIEDWSSRTIPKSLLKVYVRNSSNPEKRIDIYHFDLQPEKREAYFVLSPAENIFLTEAWKLREGRYTIPVSYDILFPLKRATLDGIDVHVPNDPKKYLQRYYGDNLDPVKIYDSLTGEYVKDLSHPYWEASYVK